MMFYVPQSRNTTVDEEDIDNTPGVLFFPPHFCVKSDNDEQIFVTNYTSMIGHSLGVCKETRKQVLIGIPANYFPDDDDLENTVRFREAFCSQIG